MKKSYFSFEAENSRRSPHYLQQIAFGLFSLVLLLAFLVSDARLYLLRSSDWLLGAVLPAVVVEKTNEARAELAISPLQRSAVLDEAARLKAEHMAKGEYFAHYSPDGTSPWHWFDEVGYVYAHAGENLAVHFTDSKKVVDAWMNSPTHRANIENLNYFEIGVGTAKGQLEGHDTVFVVQLFGTPAAPIKPAAKEEVVAEADTSTIQEVPLPEVVETVVLGEAVDTVPETVLSPEATVPAVSGYKDESVPNPTVVSLPTAEMSVAETFLATTSALLPIGTAEFAKMMEGTKTSSEAVTIIEPDNAFVSMVYTVLMLLIIVLLAFSLMLAVRYHRPWQIIYSAAFGVMLWGVTQVSDLMWWTF